MDNMGVAAALALSLIVLFNGVADVSACEVQGAPLEMLNTPSGRWTNVFPDMTFNCDGLVTSIRYYAAQKGTFFFGVWEKEADGYILQAKAEVFAKSIGVNTYSFSQTSRLPVRADQFVGVHYSTNSGNGVIPYERDNRQLTAGADVTLGPLVNSGKSNLQVFDSLHSSDLKSTKASLALSVSIVSVCEVQGASLEMLNTPGGRWTNVFPDMTFNCDGLVTSISYYAGQNGSFFFGVWEKEASSYILRAKAEVVAKHVGVNTHSFSKSSRLPVRADQFVGVHYSTNGGNAVIPYERNNRKLTGADENLGQLVASGKTNLQVGASLPASDLTTIKASLALSASVFSACDVEGAPLQMLNTPAGRWTNVFPDTTFNCDGFVTSIRYYAAQTGSFFFGVWEKEANSYILRAKTEVVASRVGVNTHNFPKSSQLPVRADQFVGVHYSTNSGKGVIPYERNNRQLTVGVDVTLGPLVASAKPNLQVGASLHSPDIMTFKSSLALYATVGVSDETEAWRRDVKSQDTRSKASLLRERNLLEKMRKKQLMQKQ